MPQSFLDDYAERNLPLAALDEGQAAEEIHFITNGAVLIGCNPGFDAERLAKLLRRNGIEPAWHYHPLDSASMAIGYLGARGELFAPPWKSDQLSAVVGLTPSGSHVTPPWATSNLDAGALPADYGARDGPDRSRGPHLARH